MKSFCWFDYKTIILTGASSGIGKGLALRLIKDHGCNIIGIARNEKKLQAVKDELGYLGEKFIYYSLDVSVKENWIKLAEELKEKNIQIDVLINNAGVLPKFDTFMNYSEDDINSAMAINFFSAVYSMNSLMPLLLNSKSPGVINIASSAALCSLAGTSFYSASKAALKSFTDAVREEYRGRCYIGLFCPGFTKTDIFRNQTKSTSQAQKAMDFVSTNCDKMVDLIIEGMWKKKAGRVLGVDAKLMAEGNKVLGSKFSFVSSQVMKFSGLSLFKDVFEKNKTKKE